MTIVWAALMWLSYFLWLGSKEYAWFNHLNDFVSTSLWNSPYANTNVCSTCVQMDARHFEKSLAYKHSYAQFLMRAAHHLGTYQIGHVNGAVVCGLSTFIEVVVNPARFATHQLKEEYTKLRNVFISKWTSQLCCPPHVVTICSNSTAKTRSNYRACPLIIEVARRKVSKLPWRNSATEPVTWSYFAGLPSRLPSIKQHTDLYENLDTIQ